MFLFFLNLSFHCYFSICSVSSPGNRDSSCRIISGSNDPERSRYHYDIRCEV